MLTDEIKATIQAAVPGATVHISDPNNDGQHFQAIVISQIFEGMMLVKQHQMVMNALKNAFAESVHALALKTFTPKRWSEVKQRYNLY